MCSILFLHLLLIFGTCLCCVLHSFILILYFYIVCVIHLKLCCCNVVIFHFEINKVYLFAVSLSMHLSIWASRQARPRWDGLWATCWLWAICCRQRGRRWGRPWPRRHGERLSFSSSSCWQQSWSTYRSTPVMGKRKTGKVSTRHHIKTDRQSPVKTRNEW